MFILEFKVKMSRKQRIQELIKQLAPLGLQIDDESANHHVPKGAETHFKLTVVAEQFNQLKTLERHRLINKLLAQEFETGLHALSLHLYTPQEWQQREDKTTNSPACRGGYQQG